MCPGGSITPSLMSAGDYELLLFFYSFHRVVGISNQSQLDLPDLECYLLEDVSPHLKGWETEQELLTM